MPHLYLGVLAALFLMLNELKGTKAPTGHANMHFEVHQTP